MNYYYEQYELLLNQIIIDLKLIESNSINELLLNQMFHHEIKHRFILLDLWILNV